MSLSCVNDMYEFWAHCRNLEYPKQYLIIKNASLSVMYSFNPEAEIVNVLYDISFDTQTIIFNIRSKVTYRVMGACSY